MNSYEIGISSTTSSVTHETISKRVFFTNFNHVAFGIPELVGQANVRHRRHSMLTHKLPVMPQKGRRGRREKEGGGRAGREKTPGTAEKVRARDEWAIVDQVTNILILMIALTVRRERGVRFVLCSISHSTSSPQPRQHSSVVR